MWVHDTTLPLGVGVLFGYPPMERSESQSRIEPNDVLSCFLFAGSSENCIPSSLTTFFGLVRFDLLAPRRSTLQSNPSVCPGRPPLEGRSSSLPLNKRMVLPEDLSPGLSEINVNSQRRDSLLAPPTTATGIVPTTPQSIIDWGAMERRRSERDPSVSVCEWVTLTAATD